jgi:hypothetical protein
MRCNAGSGHCVLALVVVLEGLSDADWKTQPCKPRPGRLAYSTARELNFSSFDYLIKNPPRFSARNCCAGTEDLIEVMICRQTFKASPQAKTPFWANASKSNSCYTVSNGYSASNRGGDDDDDDGETADLIRPHLSRTTITTVKSVGQSSPKQPVGRQPTTTKCLTPQSSARRQAGKHACTPRRQ